MDPNWAEDNLAVIRVLMERTALYRRAMAPVMIVVGATGMLAAVLGATLNFHPTLPAIGYWLCVAVVCVAEACWIIRLQALHQRELFWTPPMRRVTQAVLPSFAAGLLAALPFCTLNLERDQMALLVIPAWLVLFGIAMHSASFFMPRAFQLFAWGYIIVGLAAFGGVAAAVNHEILLTNLTVHASMGLFFGVTHVACGLYLHFTEKSGNAA